jgi:ankyrin repeat protein
MSKIDEFGFSELYLAVKAGNIELVRELVEKEPAAGLHQLPQIDDEYKTPESKWEAEWEKYAAETDESENDRGGDGYYPKAGRYAEGWKGGPPHPARVVPKTFKEYVKWDSRTWIPLDLAISTGNREIVNILLSRAENFSNKENSIATNQNTMQLLAVCDMEDLYPVIWESEAWKRTVTVKGVDTRCKREAIESLVKCDKFEAFTRVTFFLADNPVSAYTAVLSAGSPMEKTKLYLQYLVDHGFDINQVESEEEDYLTVLTHVLMGWDMSDASDNDLATVKMLLDLGADPNVRGFFGHYPLDQTSNARMIKLFLDYGANPNLPRDKKVGSPSIWKWYLTSLAPCLEECVDGLKVYLEAGCKPEVPCSLESLLTEGGYGDHLEKLDLIKETGLLLIKHGFNYTEVRKSEFRYHFYPEMGNEEEYVAKVEQKQEEVTQAWLAASSSR